MWLAGDKTLAASDDAGKTWTNLLRTGNVSKLRLVGGHRVVPCRNGTTVYITTVFTSDTDEDVGIDFATQHDMEDRFTNAARTQCCIVSSGTTDISNSGMRDGGSHTRRVPILSQCWCV